MLTELRPFKRSHFWQLFFHCRVSRLCNVSQTLQTYSGHIEDVHVGF